MGSEITKVLLEQGEIGHMELRGLDKVKKGDSLKFNAMHSHDIYD